MSGRSERDEAWGNRTAPYVRGATPEVRQLARRMRRSPTPAETVLWELLRGKQMGNFRFRRQHPLGPFVLDFCCPSARLIIEVDGEVHLEEEQRDRDRVRTEQLEAYGYRVLRLSNNDVLNQPEVVVARIREAVESYEMERSRSTED